MKHLDVHAVFTPNAFPKHTYVERGGLGLEVRLRNALAIPGAMVSLAGPSKSGKTVLVERVVHPDNLIVIHGSELNQKGLWDSILDTLGSPETRESSADQRSTYGADYEVGGKLKVPFVAEGQSKGAGKLEHARGKSHRTTHRRRGMQEVVEGLRASPHVVLIDDFHYIDEDRQMTIARECKEAARRGVTFCIASVLHRAHAVLRANPELRGRLMSLDISYWRDLDLAEIAARGFQLLNVNVPDAAISRFVRESSGSPQLMHMLCLYACLACDIKKTRSPVVTLQFDEQSLEMVFREACFFSDYSALVRSLQQGPKKRGRGRVLFELRKGGKADVYECLLRCIARESPQLHLGYSELKARLEMLCSPGAAPRSASIPSTFSQMTRIALEHAPQHRILEWLDDGSGTLAISDPYFLFYLRWSKILEAEDGSRLNVA